MFNFREPDKAEVRRTSLPRARVNRRWRTLSEVAELAALEPAQCLLEGVWADAYVALERVVQGGDGEEHQPDDEGECGDHEHVHCRALQAEEVGEGHLRLHPPEGGRAHRRLPMQPRGTE